MRVYLDDIRPIPQGYDICVRTYKAAMLVLKTGEVTFMSFDHDLGGPNNMTGYDIAQFVEKSAAKGTLPKFDWRIHSANVPGGARIRQALKSADRFWNESARSDQSNSST